MTGLFDPAVPGAVVVNGVQWQQGKGQLAKGRPVVPVVSFSSMSHTRPLAGLQTVRAYVLRHGQQGGHGKHTLSDAQSQCGRVCLPSSCAHVLHVPHKYR